MITRRIFLLALAAPAAAQPVFQDNGLAIRGFDPVAYHLLRVPTRGDARFTQHWRGAAWRFANAAHAAAFAADPERFAPAYGGFCAWAVAQGYTAPIDPTAWAIVDGRLYLNYDRSIQRRWERDIPGHIARADRNWPRLSAG